MKLEKLIRALHRVKYQVIKSAPEIAFVSGVALSGVALYSGVKAGMKVKDIVTGEEPISEKEVAIEVTKAVLPAAALEIGALVCFGADHFTLKKRVATGLAAYAALDKSFKFYRNNVIEKYGEEEDRRLRLGIKSETIEEKVVDEDGTERIVQNSIDIVEDPSAFSAYAKFFDESSREWDKSPDYNYVFLRAKQEMATKRLKAQGYLFLNDVYDMLGIPRTPAGQIVGWIFDEEHPVGDNYVDFGLTEVRRKKTRDFVNGIENVILLDFNVDGPIVDQIPFYQHY